MPRRTEQSPVRLEFLMSHRTLETLKSLRSLGLDRWRTKDLQFVTCSVRGFDHRVELAGPLDLEVLCVPLKLGAGDLLALLFGSACGPYGKVAKEDDFGHLASVVCEVRPSRFAGLDGDRELLEVSWAAFEVDFFVFDSGKEALGTVVVRRVHLALVTDDQQTAIASLAALEHFWVDLVSTVVPNHIDGRSVLGRSKFEIDFRRTGERLAVVARRGRLNADRIDQVAACEGDVEGMASHIAKCTGSESPETTPLEWMVGGIVRTHLDGSDEFVPVDFLGDRLLFGTGNALGPHRTVGPNVDLFDIAENPCLEFGRSASEPRALGALVPHLRSRFGGGCEFGDLASFPNRPGQWLLGVTSLAHLQRHSGGHRVGVVRCADGHRVDVLADLIEHLAEVIEGLCIFKVFVLLAAVEGVVVDIANRDDLSVVGSILGVAGAFAPNSDTSEPNFFDRGTTFLRGNSSSYPISSRDGRSGLEEAATILVGHGYSAENKKRGGKRLGGWDSDLPTGSKR